MVKRSEEFEKIIAEGRERKRNEALAVKIFGRAPGRRHSSTFKANAGGSLASRVGVKKRVSTGTRTQAGNINGDWTHDLHKSRGQNGSLAPRSGEPSTRFPPRGPVALRHNVEKRTNASWGSSNRPVAHDPLNVTPSSRGMTIKGLAGPYAVIAQNFAPGTTAPDIESAMTPIGGLVSSCRLVKTQPLVIAEIVFDSKDGAEAVIRTFNDQLADGRRLHVYLKPASFSPPQTSSRPGQKAVANSVVIDGSLGFDDPMDLVDDDDLYSDASPRRLYSDNLVAPGVSHNDSGSGERRGRALERGRNEWRGR